MGDPVNQLEIEVKFHLPVPSVVRDKIAETGILKQSPVFETNIRYDSGSEHLTRRNCLLRLRQDNRARLTYKSPPENSEHDDTGYKIYRELEVEISDFQTMNEMLEALGFQQVQVYEKRRETFLWNGCFICLDAMPFGDFLEIEGGDKHRIREAAELLGLDWSKRILTNYLAMFETLKAKCKWPFSDPTFHNFQSLTFDFSQYACLFEARSSS